MRYIMLLAGTLLFFHAVGQNHYLGLKGGTQISNISSTDFVDSSSSSRVGIQGGLTYEYWMNDQFYIEGAFKYEQKGFKSATVIKGINGGHLATGPDSKYNYNYLALPIKGGISFGNILSGYINLGVVPSLLLSAQTKVPQILGAKARTIDNTNDVTQIDFGGIVELGGRAKIQERISLNTSIAYQYDFNSLTNAAFKPDAKATHYGISISFGLAVALRK